MTYVGARVEERAMYRREGFMLPPPDEKVKHDAIEVLRVAGYRAGTIRLAPHPVWVEAQRIMDECS